jgi:hypothetical protein
MAEEFRAWRAVVRDKKLRQTEADTEYVCAACGSQIDNGARILLSGRHQDLATHEECASWWWDFKPPVNEDDIPF